MIRRLLLISFLALLSISPASLHLWQVAEQIEPRGVDSFEVWQTIIPDDPHDIDYGSTNDCLHYKDQSVQIVDCQDQAARPKWQSAENWTVREAISADLNRDGKRELVMVVWRPFKPWPIDAFLPSGGRIKDFHDANGMSCHVILVGWDGEKYRELWAGSALIDPVRKIQAVDLDDDGFQELVALEGEYDSNNRFGNLTVWDWNAFGFRLRDRLEGIFSEYGIVVTQQNVFILTN